MSAPRGRSSQPGIESWHCFSSGPYYDPSRIALGELIGVDEHRVAPRAGFDWHGHAGVHIVSWVLEGALRHEDISGEVRIVTPGTLFVQSTGAGIRHRETNASDTDPLTFVQVTLLVAGPVGMWSADPPAEIAGAAIEADASSVGVTVAGGRRFVLTLD